MPVSRCVRSSEPPEAVLQGLAMAGLVGILRQLGDLAELAADVFQDLQDQVMDASARGRRLAARAKQLEADLPLEAPQKQRRCMYASASDVALWSMQNSDRLRWHADPKVSHGVVPGADMPYFIAECIQRCRGPPGLSVLDKYDAHGEGACLRRYTNPSFFRTNSACPAKLQQGTIRPQGHLQGKENRPKFQSSENTKPRKSGHADYKSEADASEHASPRFLSMLRQLKHRQASRPVFPSQKPQLHHNIHKYESSPEDKASSVDHSEVDISFTSSPDLNSETGDIAVDASTATEKSRENHQCTAQFQDPVMPHCSGAGSNYGEQCGELGRTSSFEAWLSPDFRTPEHDITQESSHDPSHGFVSHVVTSNRDLTGAMMAKQNSVTAEMSSKKKSKYKGSFELITSRVSSLPRKLFIRRHDLFKLFEPALAAAHTGTDSTPAWSSGDSITSCNPADIPTEAFLPILSSDPVFSVHDFVPESEQCYLQHENTRLQSTRFPSCDASADAEIHHQQDDPSSSNRVSSSTDKYGDLTTCPDSNDLSLQRRQIGSLHKPASVLTENSCSEDAEVVIPTLPPIPPMQWLSVKAHAGPITHRKTFSKDPVQRAQRKILKTRDTYLQQEVHPEFSSGDSNNDLHVPDHPKGKLSGEQDVFYRKGAEFPAAHGNMVSTSELHDHKNAGQTDVQNSPASQNNEGCSSNLQKESVFFSAVQQLANMSPPSVPRPKYSLFELRNDPSLIHPSRNHMDERSELLEQMVDKFYGLKPVHGRSSNVLGSPTNSRVATILQRADDIRQARADDNDVGSEGSWSDSD